MINEEPSLEYNSQRPDITINEYGRNIHKMVEYCLSIADRDERNKCANAIIHVMGQLFPYLRDVDDFKHKLWDHLHIMSGFQLDVDSPYPKPSPETLAEKPEKVNYPVGEYRFGHYGTLIPELIDKACEIEDDKERQALILQLGALMKRSFVQWNRDLVSDTTILDNLNQISKGKLKIPNEKELLESIKSLPNSSTTSSTQRKFVKKKSHSNNNKSNRKKRY